jgi:predicted  nucleic acid-binding Zn-ribbon protein
MAKNDTDLNDIAVAISDLATHIDERFEQVDRRFVSIESELHHIQQKQREMHLQLEGIDSKVLGLENDIKEVYDRIVVLEKRLPHITTEEYRELEQKLDTMIAWARKVSNKTGVPLPKL